MTHSFQEPDKNHFPRAVLFDYDGVLVASESIHLNAWLQLLNELGLPNDPELIRAHVGKTAPQIIELLLNQYQPGWSASKYDIESLARRKNEFYLSFAEKSLQPYPGVIEGIQWLKSHGVALAVVSNGKRNELHRTLKFLNLIELFDEIVSRDDTGKCKPDPTPYLFAAHSLGFEPHQCMAIEDSPTGLEAALQAKIPSAAVTTNFPKNALENPVPGRPDLKPVWIGNSIQEFFDWLRKSMWLEGRTC